MKYKSAYDPLFAQIYGRKRPQNNPFVGTPSYPLGTLRPLSSYRNGRIPQDEIIMFDIPTLQENQSTSFIKIGKAGTFKTSCIKRHVKYYLDNNFKIAIIDPKSGRDWPLIQKNKKMIGLHPQETTTPYPIMAGCPSFVLNNLPPEEQKKFNTLNLPMRAFAERKLLTTLGFSPGSCEVLMRLILDGCDPKKIEYTISTTKDKNIPKQTKSNILLRIGNIIEEQFFTPQGTFNLNETWDKYDIFAIGFFDADQRYVSAYTDIILKEIKKRATNSNLKGLKEKYLVVIDDAHLVCGSDLDPDKYASLKTCINALALWRSIGINMIFSTQTPDLLHPHIYGNCKNFFVSKTSNLEVLKKHIFNREIFYAIEELDFRPRENISQWIHVHEDGLTYETYYPFNSPLPH